jgi:hypothetical protein
MSAVRKTIMLDCRSIRSELKVTGASFGLRIGAPAQLFQIIRSSLAHASACYDGWGEWNCGATEASLAKDDIPNEKRVAQAESSASFASFRWRVYRS